MDLEQLKTTLSNISGIQIEVLKARKVFTMFLSGTGLSNSNTVNQITDEVLKSVGEQYPFVEVMKNKNNFLLLVLYSEK